MAPRVMEEIHDWMEPGTKALPSEGTGVAVVWILQCFDVCVLGGFTVSWNDLLGFPRREALRALRECIQGCIHPAVSGISWLRGGDELQRKWAGLPWPSREGGKKEVKGSFTPFTGLDLGGSSCRGSICSMLDKSATDCKNLITSKPAAARCIGNHRRACAVQGKVWDERKEAITNMNPVRRR